MSFDLVVTARDRRAEVLRLLASLVAQDSKSSVRILFADQGLRLSHEDLLDVRAHDCLSLSTYEIGPSSLSSARNVAMELGGLRSRFVAFPDDDCWYAPRVLRSIQELFDALPEVDCICTHVLDPDKNLSYGHRPRDVRVPIDFSNIFYLPISVGIFVRREALERAGARFNEDLGAGTALGSGEETELVARLLDSGARVLYVGDISVFHPVPSYQSSDAKKFHGYGLGFGYLAVTFILRGHLTISAQLGSMLSRSLLGFAASLFRAHERAVYWQRFVGIIQGSALALRRKSPRKDA